jgi:hypothetical protein
MGKKLLLAFIFLFGMQLVEAQTGNRYWIAFTDKNNSPYSLNNPAAYLSQRAIQRRTNQGIAIDSSDLPVNRRYLDSLIAKGATVRHTSKWLNGATVEVPNLQVLADIQALPFVRASRKTGRISYQRPVIEDKFGSYTHASPMMRIDRLTNADYGASYNQIRLHNGDVLHNLGYRGEGMRIAVFDAGFINVNVLSCFDSLFSQNRIVDTYDFVDLNTNPYVFDSHGTYVLGCMAGVIPGELIGTAPRAQYMLYRTENNVAGSENQIEEDNWVAAAERADSAGADVFNTSLSYTTFDDPSMNYSYADMNGNTARITRASDMAAKKGILVVASAGNYGGGGWTYIGAPADGDSVLSVGATNAEGQRIGFSSLGPTSDGRIKPEVMAQGSAAVSCALNGQGITFVSGTSFSGPIMAGLATILWQAHPTRTNMQIFEALKQSGSNRLTPNNQLGWGLPDLQLALNSLSARDISAVEQLKVYPNPFSDRLQIQFEQKISSINTLNLRDLQGRIVYSENMGRVPSGMQGMQLTLPETLVPGMYLLEISNEYNTIVNRVVKQ